MGTPSCTSDWDKCGVIVFVVASVYNKMKYVTMLLIFPPSLHSLPHFPQCPFLNLMSGVTHWLTTLSGMSSGIYPLTECLSSVPSSSSLSVVLALWILLSVGFCDSIFSAGISDHPLGLPPTFSLFVVCLLNAEYPEVSFYTISSFYSSLKSTHNHCILYHSV